MKSNIQKIMWSILILLLAVPLYAQNVVPVVDAAVNKLTTINSRLAGAGTSTSSLASADPNLSLHMGNDGAIISNNKNPVIFHGGITNKTSNSSVGGSTKTSSGKSGGQ